MNLIKHIRRFLTNNHFARNVTILAGGTAAGQLIGVLASPILTRLYSPDDFGALAVFTSVLMTLGVISSLRYQLTIPLPEDDQEAAYVLVLSLSIVSGLTILTSILVVLFGDEFTVMTNTAAIAEHLWLLPVGLFFFGVYQVFNYWAIRVKAFDAIARTKLTRNLSLTLIQIGGFSFGPLALLIGKVAGEVAGIGTLGLLTIRKSWSKLKQTRWSDIHGAAKRYRRFPIYSSLGGVVNRLSTELPSLLFASLFSTSAAGFYIIANRVLTLPFALVSRAIADVFLADAAQSYQKGKLAPLIEKVHDYLSMIAAPPTLILIVYGPVLFSYVFGPDWLESGMMVRWLAIAFYFQFISSPISTVFTVIERPDLTLIMNLLLFGLRSAALLVGSILGDLMLSVLLFSVFSAVGYSIYSLSSAIKGGCKAHQLLAANIRSLLKGLLVIAPAVLMLLIDIHEGMLMISVVGVAIATVIYYLRLVQNTSVFDT